MNETARCHIVELAADHASGVLKMADGKTRAFAVIDARNGTELQVGDHAWVTQEDQQHAPYELTVPRQRVGLRIRVAPGEALEALRPG